MNFNENNPNKRHNYEPSGALQKRQKYSEINASDEQFEKLRSAYFQVSYKNYIDYSSRFSVVDPPSCVIMICKHQERNERNIRATPSYIVDSFKTEFKNKMWYEALEVCRLSLTTTQYLSSDMLKNIVEIMLNAREDKTADYSVNHILDRCQLILIENFKRHPPCLNNTLRECYEKFLTSPMTTQKRTLIDKNYYNLENGILKYCINGLRKELVFESTEESLVSLTVPKNISDDLRKLQWQKENLEIFEALNKEQRIERVFTVLEVLIILLQFDLAILNVRATSISERRSRTQRKLLDCLLWPDFKSTTLSRVNKDCTDILDIYAHIIHHQYSERSIKIMTAWVNIIIQTFYMQDINANSDYPNSSSYCTEFANEFYKIISGLPDDSINRILERIEPTFMRYLVGIRYLHNKLRVRDACVITTLIDFIKKTQWKNFITDSTKLPVTSFLQKTKVNNKLDHLLLSCPLLNTTAENTPKQSTLEKNYTHQLNQSIQALYTTLEAYLNTYGVRQLLEICTRSLHGDNRQNPDEYISPEQTRYSITDWYVEKYILGILQLLEELVDLVRHLKLQGKLPIELIAIEQLVTYTYNLQC